MAASDESHPFLSPAWIAAARAIRDEYSHRVDAPTYEVRANVIITETPFDDGFVHGHIDTTAGTVTIEEGHLDEPELTIEVAYEIAISIFVERDPQAAMQAFFGGRIKVTGDSSKLLTMPLPAPGAEPDDLALEVARRVDAITAKPDDGSND